MLSAARFAPLAVLVLTQGAAALASPPRAAISSSQRTARSRCATFLRDSSPAAGRRHALAATCSRAPHLVARSTAATTDRRGALFSLGAGALSLALQPRSAEASYAMYAASQDSFQERKATGFVPVATSDKASLAEIQQGIAYKRPQSAMKVKKAPQYCAGQMSSVQPMMENVRTGAPTERRERYRARQQPRPPRGTPFSSDPPSLPPAYPAPCPPCPPPPNVFLTRVCQICANIGTSKADQSNTRVDAFGNMNVGQFQLDEFEAQEKARNAAKNKR